MRWIWATAALIASSSPAAAQKWPPINGWLTVQKEDGCITSTSYEGKGETWLAIVSYTDGTHTLAVTKQGWSTRQADEMDFIVELDGRRFEGSGWGMASDDGRGGFIIDIDARFTVALARANSIVILRNEIIIESLSLKGSGAAIAQLNQCTAKAKATRSPEQREKDRESLILANPFERPGSRSSAVPDTPGKVASTAVPRGQPQSWVTNDDYPASALRAGEQGTTGFRLEIDPTGRVTRCTVTQSSGSTVLDSATCSLITRRARFTPARDEKGNAVGAQWSSRFRWESPLPTPEPSPTP